MRKFFLILGFLLLILILLSPLYSLFGVLTVGRFYAITKYTAYYIYCGHKPILASNFAAGYSYDTPESDFYDPSDPFTSAYFCNKKDAERDGFRMNPLQ